MEVVPVSKAQRRVRIIHFFEIFLGLGILFGGILFWLYSTEHQASKEAFHKDVETYLERISDSVEQDLEDIYGDSLFLRNYIEKFNIGKRFNSEEKLLVENLFIEFARARGDYNQIRFLSLAGDEVIRVNKSDLEVESVSESELQNKSKRYYFEESVKLDRNQIYVSPMDLNIENGLIEIPYKPMIRIGTAVYGEDENRIGVIVNNFCGQQLLNRIQNYYSKTLDVELELELLNEQGYYLKTVEAENEWGFMFGNEYSENNLKLENEVLWDKILNHKKYKEILDEEQYYVRKIELDRSKNPNYSVVSDYKNWILMARVPHGVIDSKMDYIKRRYMSFFIFTMITIAGIAFLISYYSSKKIEYNEKLNKLAYTDKLTGLDNRFLFMKSLKQYLNRLVRYEEDGALFFLDLDGFKYINDTYGHEAGDILLTRVAGRFRGLMRESDFIGRIGGDEFTILAVNVQSKEEISKIGQRILEEIRRPYIINGQKMEIGISIGIARLPQDGLEQEIVLKKADEAMYYVKSSTKNDYCFYEDMEHTEM
jgi:diguanylate cyclase (GGDEF)-like protein